MATVLFPQTYVYRVAAPMLAAWILRGRIPDVSAANLAPRFNAVGRPQEVAMRAPRVYALTGDIISDAEVIQVTDLASGAIEVLFAPELEGSATHLEDPTLGAPECRPCHKPWPRCTSLR